MTRTSPLERLQLQKGRIIEHASEEIFVNEDRPGESIISLSLTIREGSTFTFSCSGAGDISIRSSSQSLPTSFSVRRLSTLEGACIKSVESTANEISIEAGSYTMKIINDDDDLAVQIEQEKGTQLFDSAL